MTKKDHQRVVVMDEDAADPQGNNPLEVWHRRLGHLNQHNLLEAKRRYIIPSGNIEDFRSTLRCQVYMENKMSRTPFPEKSKRATDILEIVHSDDCDPMRAHTHVRNKYFVTFIDDHSRWCEVRFSRSEDQVFDAYKDCKTYIENQSGRKIKILQSDNGKEYIKSHFDQFLNDDGIKGRLSFAYNS